MALPVNIRAVEPGDHAGWLAMRYTLWPHCTPELHASEIRDYFIKGGELATFVAEDDSRQLCGFIEASLRQFADGCESSPVGYIEGIFVQPAFRRCGVGSMLVGVAEKWVKSRGCVEFASDCYTHNKASIEFHRHLGFDIAERLVHFRRELQ